MSSRLAFIVLVGSTAPLFARDDYRPLRPSVLGFRIDHDASVDRYRLVAENGEGKVLHSGDLEACEKRLLEELKAKHGTGNGNLAFITLGGKQFWGDRAILAGWRIQENVYTGHCRLLDPSDVRQAWGSFEACRTVLEEKRQLLGLKPRSDRLVLLVHGMGRSKSSFAKLEQAIGAAGYEVASVAYPSTRKTIREHSGQLAELLASYEGVRSVSFVTHSLGGIVVRDLLSQPGWQKRVKPERLVMLAPPNRGSLAAGTLKDWFPYQALTGKAGQQLTPEEVAKVPSPTIEFGIIAGGSDGGKGEGYNPLLPGDDDGVVSVDEAKLDGAKDFLVLKALHSFIMDADDTREAVLRFLSRGRFTAN